MAKGKATKIVSKKHLARQQREQQQSMIITWIAAVIILAVVGLIIYGILDQTVLLARRPIVTVNGESVSVRDFQAEVRATRQQLINQYLTYEQYTQMGLDLSSQTSQIQSELDNPAEVGQQVLTNIQDSILIRQYAAANGITVTEAEIESELQKQFAYFPNGKPTPTVTSTPAANPTLSSTQLALVTATFTPTSEPTVTLAPSLTPDLSATSTSVPSITPTATPYTLEAFQNDFKDVLKQYTKLGMSESYFRRIYIEDNLYRQRVKDQVTADVSHEQEQVWLRQILVPDGQLAAQLYLKLRSGSDFTTLAASDSIDTASKDKGGDLGWLSVETLTSQYGEDFKTAVLAMKVGELLPPIQTGYGWHIVQLIDHQTRTLSDSDYQSAVDSAFTAWLKEQTTSATIVTASNWTSYVPTDPTIASVQVEIATQQSQTLTALPSDTPAPEQTGTPTP